MPESITIVGNVTAEPELRFVGAKSTAVASFTVADTPRVKDGNDWKDGETIWWRVSIWQDAAENVTESLSKGTRVIVTGIPKQSNWEKDGVKHSRIELTATEVGVSLKWATARAVKATKDKSSPPTGGGFAGADEEPPF